jgi:hypothetical protein
MVKVTNLDDILAISNRRRAEVEALRAENERLRALLRRLYEWDHMDSAADGAFWRSEIDKALGRLMCRYNR